MPRHFSLKLERGFLRQLVRLLRVRDTNDRVARGVAAGLIVNFFPTFGLGVLISGFVARLFGGNAIAGLVGGASLMFFWPVLFYLNIKVGGLMLPPDVVVNELGDVTEKTVNALVWGKTFLLGAVLNSLAVGLAVYFLTLLLYGRLRPAVLTWCREFMRSHQIRFRRRRPQNEKRPL
ncbi:MAG TPA: DUF2062 domain-containing protein [Verrucomicrobiae bacterium]|nr:DUF2062 domain-containing protein [Verrucomicrobiae bacterium]